MAIVYDLLYCSNFCAQMFVFDDGECGLAKKVIVCGCDDFFRRHSGLYSGQIVKLNKELLMIKLTDAEDRGENVQQDRYISQQILSNLRGGSIFETCVSICVCNTNPAMLQIALQVFNRVVQPTKSLDLTILQFKVADVEAAIGIYACCGV